MSTDIGTKRRIRATNRLSAIKVAKLRVPGLYEDGAGLRLVVTERGTKRWTLRVTVNGRRLERGLGVFPDVGLDDARVRAVEIRRAAKLGRDLRVEQRHARRTAVTFVQAFEDYFAIRSQQLSDRKTIQQWRNTMRDYVFPKIGHRPVAEITAAEILDVVRQIWFTRPKSAARVLQRPKAVFDGAILRGLRERANPTIGVAREASGGVACCA